MMSSRYSTDFKELKELGKGGFGKVFLCENVLDQKKYALKKIPIKDGHREKVLREVVALSTMHHHHVVRYFQAWIEDGCTVELSSSEEESTSDESVKPNATLYIQMKFCPQTLSGLLESLRDSKTVLDTSTIWRYFRQTVEGLRYIHGQNFVHRDLTRSNIFLDDDQIVIGDFGLATFLHDMNSGGVVTGDAGNLLYMAPELKEQDGPIIVSDRADIFSLGLLLCDLLYKFKTDGERMEVFTKLRRGEFPESAEPILKDLLASTPSARPSASEILQRPLPWGEVGCDENYVHELEDKVRTLSAQLVKAEKIQSLNKMLNPLTDDTD